jgi:hypothetical protein
VVVVMEDIRPARGLVHGIIGGLLFWATVWFVWTAADAIRVAGETSCPDVCEREN